MEQIQGLPNTMALQTSSLRATLSTRRLALVIFGLMLAMLMNAVETMIVSTAMPRVIADLNGLDRYAWVFTAYMLASTVAIPIYGKLSDIYGRRPFFLGGMLVFLIGSALSGASQDMNQLIVSRAIQGLGAGGMMPLSQAVVGDIFPPRERGKWQGVIMSLWAIGTIFGPTLGGWISDNWGWRWVFYMNMPVGALALLTAGIAMPGLTARHEHTIDYLGAGLLAAGTVALLLALSWAGSTYAWFSFQILGTLLLALVSYVLFLRVERRAAEPIMRVSYFRNGIFAVSVIATFLLSAGMFSNLQYTPLFVQGVIGASATSSGTVMTAHMIAFMVSNVVTGQLLSRIGRYKLLAMGAFVLALAGTLLFAAMNIHTTTAQVTRNMVLTGLGIGMGSLFVIVVQNAFPHSELGQVTATLQFFRSIGGTMGTALLGTVLTNSFQSAFQSNLTLPLRNALPPERLGEYQNPQVLLTPAGSLQLQQNLGALGPQGERLFEQMVPVLRASLSDAITSIFTVCTILMLLGLVATLFLREIPLRSTFDSSQVPPPVREQATGAD